MSVQKIHVNSGRFQPAFRVLDVEQEFFHILSYQVGLDIYEIPHLFARDIRLARSLGNDINLKSLFMATVDRQTDSVHCNGTLFDRVPCNSRLQSYFQPGRAPDLFLFQDFPDSIHMAGNKMASETVRYPERPLQIDHLVLFKPAERAPGKGLSRNIRSKGPLLQAGYGEADAIDADALPQPAVDHLEKGKDSQPDL